MLQLDPDDPDDEENAKVLTALSSGNNTMGNPNNTGGPASILTEADQIALANYKVCTLKFTNITCNHSTNHVTYIYVIFVNRITHHLKCPSW